jgi:hypothetical protein
MESIALRETAVSKDSGHLPANFGREHNRPHIFALVGRGGAQTLPSIRRAEEFQANLPPRYIG